MFESPEISPKVVLLHLLPRFSSAVFLQGMRPLLLLLVVACPVVVQADSIELRNGQRFEGIIIREDGDKVDIETSGGRLSLGRERIQRVDRESDGLNGLRRAEQTLRRGKSGEAIRQVEEAIRGGVAPADVRHWCVSRQSLLNHAVGPADLAAQGEWVLLFRRLADLPTSTSAESSNTNKETTFTIPVLSNLDEIIPTSTPLVSVTPAPSVSSASELPSKEELLKRGQAIFAAAASRRAAAGKEKDSTTQTAVATPTAVVEISLPLEQSEFLLTMAKMLEEKGERRTAAQMMGRLDSQTMLQAMKTEDFVQPLIIELVKDQLDAYDFESASNLISRMEGAGMVGGEACRILLFLRWSSFERHHGEFENALEVLSKRLAPLSPSLARERMQATLSEAGEELAAKDSYEEAVSLYEKWGNLLTPSATKEALATLYHDWGKYLLEQKEPDKARPVLQKYLGLAPDGDRSLLDLCDYNVKLLALDPRDFASHYELGQWAADHGLATEAIQSYELAAAHPELRAPAEQQIANLQERIAVTHMDRCMKFYEKGDPKRALEELGKFPYLPAARKMELEITNLRNLCFAEIGRRSALQEVQAQTLLQDAQRHFFLGQRKTAIEQLEKILDTYPKAPVVDEAREFLKYVRTRIEVERLEGASELAAGNKSSQQPGLQPQISNSLENEIKQLIEQLRTGVIETSVTVPVANNLTTGSLPTVSPTPPTLAPPTPMVAPSITNSPRSPKDSAAGEVK